jgi:hypothetical protein
MISCYPFPVLLAYHKVHVEQLNLLQEQHSLSSSRNTHTPGHSMFVVDAILRISQLSEPGMVYELFPLLPALYPAKAWPPCDDWMRPSAINSYYTLECVVLKEDVH